MIMFFGISVLAIPVEFALRSSNNYIFQSVSSLIVAVYIIGTLLIILGYFTFFEMIFNGQTFGKKIMKLRVIKENGEPIGIYESLIRNLVKLILLFPIANAIDFIVVLNSKRYKRLGDIAANTIVIKERSFKDYKMDINKMERIAKGVSGNGSFGFRVDNEEYGILRELFERKDLGVNKLNVAVIMREYFKLKFNVEINEQDTFKFLSEIYKAGSKQ